ncbi:hypothetical protein RN001_006858 [Aquatica leii]|uniref:Uncharacterized protein n=1 Tax=Aquatica leii TaxID=1421715 RepID=A0AAN7PE64_9COLE|nr:hypothetical protein RN001_006858 [Aquatica leii]
MITNDYSISIQLPSDISTVSSSKYYKSKALSSQDLRKGFEVRNDSITFSTGTIDNSVSNICETFVQEERNCNVNLAFCMTPTAMQLNTMPPPPHNVYSHKRNEWDNSKNDECSLRENKFENGLSNIGYRYKYQNTFYNNNYTNDENASEMVCNSVAVTQHRQRSTTNYNKNRYFSQNGKRPKRDYKRQCTEEIVRRVHGLMERFTSRAKLFKIDRVLSYSGKMSPLDRSIWELFYAKAQTQEIYLHKLSIWKKLFLHVTKLFDRYGLFMVGSTMSGLATKSSDIDLCLLLRSCPTDTRADAVHYLEMIRNSLLNCDFAQASEVIHAKVPILKFKTTHHGFEVDLNCNNAVGIRNTHLLHCYTQLDWRVRPLVTIVKLWAQANGINDAKNMTISSYSLALMVIHFLQCGVIPPVIPCLHGLYPDKFNPEREIHDIDIQEELPVFVSDNKQTLGELLQRFLYYYASFNYDMYAISVRVASRVLIDECRYARSPKNDPHQWKYLCIEEPFDLTNTARSVYDLLTFKRIQRVFQVSSNLLLETENLSCILMNTNENQR